MEFVNRVIHTVFFFPSTNMCINIKDNQTIKCTHAYNLHSNKYYIETQCAEIFLFFIFFVLFSFFDIISHCSKTRMNE